MGEEFVDRWVLGGVEAVVFFTLWREEDDGGKAFDLILFGIGLVLLGNGFVTARVVELDEDEVLGGFGGEAFLREDFIAHHLAGRAPIGACKLDEDVFIFFFCFGKGGFEIGAPVLIRSCGEGSGEK